MTFPHLVTVSLPSQTQFTLRFNVPKHSGPTGSSLHTSTLLQKRSRFIWIKLDYARLTWKQESALTIQSRRNQSDRLVSRQPRHNPPTPRKPALRWTASSSASYLPWEASCWSAEEPGGVTRGRSKAGEQSLRSRTWFIHVRDREHFPSHHLLSPPRGSPCALLAPPTSKPLLV